jgi:putative restriction endonuclease
MATEQWLGKLAKLKVDKARGDPAPHKPLLLLVVLELAEQAEGFGELVALTPELAFRFCTFWSIVAQRRTQPPDVRYPFYHLKSDGFWSPVDEDGKPAVDRRFARYAALPSDFVEFARDPAYRDRARRTLIAKYFQPDERAALYSLVGIPVPDKTQIASDASFKSSDDAAKQGREVRFRLNVVAAYGYTCALTRYRLTTIGGATIVDAAHIHQFSDSRNNNPTNGLALCKNAHWLFDNGLWSLTDDYKVIVAEGHFSEAGTDQMLLRKYHGQRIHLPGQNSQWPSPIHLAWHRKRKFRGAC